MVAVSAPTRSGLSPGTCSWSTVTTDLVIDPAADNAAAIRSYTKVGFRPVGIMRRYERVTDGTWHDSLLMDLLADELVDPLG